MKFQEGFAAKIVVQTGKTDVQVFDDELPGFGMRKFASGACSYFVKYQVITERDAKGRGVKFQQRRKSLGAVVKGNLKDMRLEASNILAKAHLGTDVVGEAKAAGKPITTLGSLIPIYLAAREKELRDKSYRETDRYLSKIWKPLHGQAIDAIGRRDIVAILDLQRPVSADRAKAALSGLYGWAIERGYLDINPTIGIRSRGQNGGRTRVLSEAELVAIWQACRDDDFGRIIRLLILTGQRETEIGSLRWSEIDLEKRLIELPPSRTKNKRPHLVPLSDQALAIIQSASRSADGPDCLFGRDGHGFKNWSLAKSTLDARIAASGTPMPHWTIHDIRRSFVTHTGDNGFAQPHVVEAILNHVSGSKSGVAGVYNKATYLNERRQALDIWAQHVAALVAGDQSPAAKIVPLKRTA